MSIKAPRGTQDVLPSQSYKWNFVEGKFRAICDRYGFKEIRTPIFEHTDLFSRGVGESTDIVSKEMYTFEDRSHRSITLKPEGTAPVVRAYIENKEYANTQPVKYSYITPCFRYEKPQAGRLRQFHQMGIEIFGTDSMMADAEIIALADDFLRGFGISDLELKINSVGCPECRAKYQYAIRDMMMPKKDCLCGDCNDRIKRNPMRILDCKVEKCKEITSVVPPISEYLCDSCSNAFEELQRILNVMGIPFVIDHNIVRGLDYYTKTAFEFVTNSLGSQGTVCGGGRYDGLVKEIGGNDTPGVGFGLGVERLIMLLDALDLSTGEPSVPDVVLISMGEAAKEFVLKLATEYRKSGMAVQVDLNERNIKGQLKYAHRIGAKYAVIIGDDELEHNSAIVKNMLESSQKDVPFEELFKELKA